jgi:hypothetical protein
MRRRDAASAVPLRQVPLRLASVRVLKRRSVLHRYSTESNECSRRSQSIAPGETVQRVLGASGLANENAGLPRTANAFRSRRNILWSS